jgi:predicted PurR-regulated permease PerM
MKADFKPFHPGRAFFFLIAFIAWILAGAVLKITAPVLLPFTISILLAFVMTPLVAFLEQWHIPRIFSILLAIGIIITGLYLIGIVLFSAGRTILTLYPKYEDRLTEIYIWVADFFELSYDAHLSFFENLWSQLGVRTRVRNLAFDLSNFFIGFLKDAVMVVLFVVFLLIEATYFKEKIDLAFEKRAGQIKRIGADVMHQVTRYLSAKFLISLATGISVTLGLGFVGLEFAILWGVLQFILNFIPNIGSIVVGVGATLFALLQFWPEPTPIILVGIIMLSANMIIGNVLEPMIMGDNLGISPLIVLLALMIWGWLWGFMGMILAVPMMVIIQILCENIPILEPLSILMGSRKAILAKQAKTKQPSAGRGEDGI